MNPHIYIAGSLFSESEQNMRRLEEHMIKSKLYESGDVRTTIFNPITNPVNDKSKLPTALDIYTADTKEIIKSTHVLLNLDNQLDAGVFVELGQIVGLSCNVGGGVNAPTSDPAPGSGVEPAPGSASGPRRKLYPVISDMRVPTASSYHAETIPWGINQYVIGALISYDPDITFYTSAKDAIKAMVDDIAQYANETV